MRAQRDHTPLVLSALGPDPRTIADIAAATGLYRRRVEEALEAIRARGLAPVCSGPAGVWIARDLADFEASIEADRRRAVRQLTTVRAMRRLRGRLAAPTVELWRKAS